MIDRIRPAQLPAKQPYRQPLLTKHQPLLAITGKSPATEKGTDKVTTFVPGPNGIQIPVT
jgi:hypothetical protein